MAHLEKKPVSIPSPGSTSDKSGCGSKGRRGLVFSNSIYRLFQEHWAEVITKVSEADPLLCARCGGAMHIIAFIDQPDVIEKILHHLGLWPAPSHAPPDGAVA